ncbi:MAG: LysM peptidoglycan-binding domain-containing protein [Dolichospermum sp. DEX189]|jgi:nucleoid-associated protein YgaU|nr:LysM peptidoglycan-binding domain-containing protein [Dolichospermum sp. DEX189]
MSLFEELNQNTQNQAQYTVESGDSLWKIAEEVYGDGTQWTKIYEANRGVLSWSCSQCSYSR